MRPFSLVGFLEMCEERDDLHRLAEAHLIGQDPIHLLGVEHGQPVEAHHLVRCQGEAAREVIRNLNEACDDANMQERHKTKLWESPIILIMNSWCISDDFKKQNERKYQLSLIMLSLFSHLSTIWPSQKYLMSNY